MHRSSSWRGDVRASELSGRLSNFTVKWSCICRTSTGASTHTTMDLGAPMNDARFWFDFLSPLLLLLLLPLLLLHCYCILCTACFCNEHTSIDHGCHNWPEPSITTVIVQDYRGTLTDRKQGEAETDLASPVCVYCVVGRRSEGCSMTSFSVLVSI